MGRTVVCLLLAAACALAQTPWATSIRPALDDRELAIDRGAAALWQSLKKLGTRASLIMITAHPDDEDAGMLTYESRGVGARVHLLTLNRGEGGANVMSGDFFDALGLVRTMEMLAAGRWYGVEQHWTRVVDYGFSKTKAESISPLDARPGPRRRGPRHSRRAAAGDHLSLRRPPQRRPWQSRDRRRDGPGGLSRRRRPESLPRARSALGRSQGLRPRSRWRVARHDPAGRLRPAARRILRANGPRRLWPPQIAERRPHHSPPRRRHHQLPPTSLTHPGS